MRSHPLEVYLKFYSNVSSRKQISFVMFCKTMYSWEFPKIESKTFIMSNVKRLESAITLILISAALNGQDVKAFFVHFSEQITIYILTLHRDLWIIWLHATSDKTKDANGHFCNLNGRRQFIYLIVRASIEVHIINGCIYLLSSEKLFPC